MMTESEKTSLSLYCENPDNPRSIADDAAARLIGKLRRVPDGLAAMRIAYVTDDPRAPGKRLVISGNQRLRALREIHGPAAEVPAEWFQDVTAMTPEQRREFVVAANASEGEWDAESLLAQYGRDDLRDLLGDDSLDSLLDSLPAPPPEDGGGALPAAADRELPALVRAFFLVSFPISRFGEFSAAIADLRGKGADVDECLE